MGDDESDAEQAVERFILQEANRLLANIDENDSLSAFLVKTTRQVLDDFRKISQAKTFQCWHSCRRTTPTQWVEAWHGGGYACASTAVCAFVVALVCQKAN